MYLNFTSSQWYVVVQSCTEAQTKQYSLQVSCSYHSVSLNFSKYFLFSSFEEIICSGAAENAIL